MENKAQQYYPTYQSKERDILLLEFEEANKIANSQTKVYGQMASLLIGLITILISFFLNIVEGDKSKDYIQTFQKTALPLSIIIFIFGAFLLRYFVDLQKQITINARKVVTLRVLLGLDYGAIQLTLPNWRVEGATNPFAIKYFTGWFSFRSSPFWVLLIGVNLIWWLATNDRINITIFNNVELRFFYGHILITVVYFQLFRVNLNDRHETSSLNFKKGLLKLLLGIKLVPDFEYVLYRAKLAYIELERLEVDYSEIKKIVVSIEDRSFYSNNGVSYKSLFRSLLSRIKWFRKKYGYLESGGSTITMQLARTLFIRPTSDKYGRKVAEIFLSPWLNKQFSKEEILKLYISSVQFEKGIVGLSNAIKHFFQTSIKGKKLSKEECFFLVERLSNITSTVRWDRIRHLVKLFDGQLNFNDIEKVYKSQIEKGRLKEQ